MKVKPWPAQRSSCRWPLHVFFIYSSVVFTSGWEIEVATSGTDFYYPWVLCILGCPLRKSFLLIVSEEGRGFGNMHSHRKDRAALAISVECISLFNLGVNNGGNDLKDQHFLPLLSLLLSFLPFSCLALSPSALLVCCMYDCKNKGACMPKCSASIYTLNTRSLWTVSTFISLCCITEN